MVAAVLVVVLLLLVVILPSLSTSSGSPGSGGGLASEQTAAAIAGSFTNRLAGGPWQLVDAFGSLTTTETVVSISNLFPSNASCPLLDQTVASVELAPFNGTYESGLAEAWVFLYWASGVGGNSALGIFVQSGSAVELGEESGAGCYITTPLTLGTDLIDSTAAAQAAVATASGSTFIAAVHHANATYSLEPVSYTSGGSSKTASLWYVLFSGKAGSADEDLRGRIVREQWDRPLHHWVQAAMRLARDAGADRLSVQRRSPGFVHLPGQRTRMRRTDARRRTTSTP